MLKAQIEKYDDVENDVKFLHEFSTQNKRADFAGFIMFNDEGDEIFTFGKYKGRKVGDILIENPGYYSWIQNAEFPLYTKKVLSEIKENAMNNKVDDLKNKFNQKL